ncbi:MAG TPA: ChbG/HpnK family deacetylase [Gemmatimonadaceae bacterium]
MGSTPSPTRLIINADDFGISRGVNIGIIEAAEAGVVTSASIMVNLPGFADALDRALSCPALSLGLHLNLTAGRPLTDVPSLTRRSTGEFYALPVLVARASLGLLNEWDIARECLAQIDRMSAEGFPPTHLDSHRHVHAHPAISSAVITAAASRGVFQVRVPTEPLWLNARDWRATLKKAGLLACARLSSRTRASDGAIRFVGLSLQGGSSFAKRLFALIPQLPAGTTELMTHPGYADDSLAEQDSYTLQRETELRVLCSREFRELLARCGVDLASFADGSSIVPRQDQLAQHH